MDSQSKPHVLKEMPPPSPQKKNRQQLVPPPPIKKKKISISFQALSPPATPLAPTTVKILFYLKRKRKEEHVQLLRICSSMPENWLKKFRKNM